MNAGSPSNPRVLVVDAQNVSFVVQHALAEAAIETMCVGNAIETAAAMTAFKPHLLVLEVTLPGVDVFDGFDVARRLRAGGNTLPIVFLTSRDGLDDRLTGLALGDDYVVKPFIPAEFVARVRNILRRAGAGTDDDVLRLLDLEVDRNAHRVTRSGQTIAVSPTEFRLLSYLLVNAGRVLSRAQILAHVWRDEFDRDSSIVETYMSYLRRKVDSTDTKLIHTIRGVGYCLRVEA